MRILKILLVAAACILPLSVAMAQSKPVTVDGAWVRVHEGGVTVYFDILNNSAEADHLMSVSTPLAERAEVVRTRIRSGKFSYQPTGSLEVGGYETIRMAPGGVHIRLTGVQRALHVGDAVPLTLRFVRSGTMEISARVGNRLLGDK